MEERISEVLARHRVRLVQFENSRMFGNILLIVAAPCTQLRFVRDRGMQFMRGLQGEMMACTGKMTGCRHLLSSAISLIFAILSIAF